jgi:hypothetical protein
MKRPGAIAAAYLLLTFCAGVAVGGLGFWLYETRTVKADVRKSTAEDYRKKYLEEMQSRLKLSQDQVHKLTAILDTTRNTFRELNEKHRPEYKAVHDNQRGQIRAILEEPQKAEYEKMLQERAARSKRSGRPEY